MSKTSDVENPRTARSFLTGSPWNRFGTRVTVTMVGLVVTVALALGAILTAESVRAMRNGIRQTGTAFTLLLATELEQKSKMSERLLSRNRRPPPWLSGLPPGRMPPGEMDRSPEDAPPPPMAPPPPGPDKPQGVPPFVAEDLLEIANLIGAQRIAILAPQDVLVNVTRAAEPAGAFDPAAAYEQWNRLKTTPDELVILEKIGDTISIVTTFSPAGPVEERGLLVEFPVRSAQRIVQSQILVLTLATLTILTFAAWLAYVLSRSISRPLSRLVEVASVYGAGNLDRRAAEEGPAEIASLGRAFNEMAASLDSHIDRLRRETARREQLEGELRIAAELQRSLLPDAERTIVGPLEILGSCEAAREVGGDFYDFWFLDKNHLAVVIGDATGKGLTAALLASKSLSVIQALAGADTEPSVTLSRANSILCRQFKNDGLFVTALLVAIDLRDATITYSVAGHSPAFLLRQGVDSLELLQSHTGLPLGITSDVEFETRRIAVNGGCRLMLYTDGVTETFDSSMNCFGQDRLARAFAEYASCTVSEAMEGIKKDVRNFCADRPSGDDSTIVLVSVQSTIETANGEQASPASGP